MDRWNSENDNLSDIEPKSSTSSELLLERTDPSLNVQAGEKLTSIDPPTDATQAGGIANVNQGASINAEEESLLSGIVRSISFRNAQTEFAVFRADTPTAPGSASKTVTTVTGVVPHTLRVGTPFVARGRWEEHPKFGPQFRARSITETPPTGTEELVEYLGSGEIRGIGPALAARIVERFGQETLTILDNAPERLQEVSGIGTAKLEEIRSVWQDTKREREVMLFLQRLNLGAATTQRIRKRYGLKVIEVLSSDPYVLVEDLWGVGFLKADEIARELGIEANSSQRIRAGILHELKRAGEDGNCYLNISTLLQKAQSLLQLDDIDRIRKVFDLSISEAHFVVDETGERVYHPAIWQAETQAANSIASRLSNPDAPLPAIPPFAVNEIVQATQTLVDQFGSVTTIRLSTEQQRAISLASEQHILVITGGPGCGKTTVLRTLVQLFSRQGLKFRLAAPTGKASQRLAEVCNHEASTIHRLLKFDPISRAFAHDADNQLEVEAVIIDEVSMVDLPLAASLLQAIPKSARIIFVGDADQLPSVGPGLFLADLLAIPSMPQVRLTNLFRRSEQSLISFIAHQINAGDVPEIPTPDGLTKSDAYFLPASSLTEAAALIERLVVDQIPKKFGISGTAISVLTPMNQGELGVIALNQRLQQRLVPPSSDPFNDSSVKVGNVEFRLGDRVCQRMNNYNIIDGGVFNGEQGEVVGIDPQNRKLFVRFWDGREVSYGSDNLSQLDLAYAISIHRAQGSESRAVVLAIHEAHSILLERQLIYTAVTRAKQLLVVVGTRKALVYGVRRTPSKRRNTNLVGRVSLILAHS